LNGRSWIEERDREKESRKQAFRRLLSVRGSVLIQVKIVGGGDGEDVIFGMPGGVQYLLVEVEAVDGDFVLAPFVGRRHLARFQHAPGPNRLARRLERGVALRVAVEQAEEVVVASGHDLLIVAGPSAFELVEDAIVLVERAQFAAQILVNLVRFHRLVFHVDVPDFDGKVVARHEIASAVAELDVGDAGDDLGEEAAVRRVFRLLEQFRVFVAKRRRPHVAIPDRAFARTVHERRAVLRMKFCGCYHFRQVFHVSGFDVDDVERLIRYLQIPQIDPQIVGTHVRLIVTVN